MALMDHVRKRDLPPEIKCRQVSSHQIAPLLYSLVQYHINFGGIGFDRCSMQPGINLSVLQVFPTSGLRSTSLWCAAHARSAHALHACLASKHGNSDAHDVINAC